jgi:hypothetical protein
MCPKWGFGQQTQVTKRLETEPLKWFSWRPKDKTELCSETICVSIQFFPDNQRPVQTFVVSIEVQAFRSNSGTVKLFVSSEVLRTSKTEFWCSRNCLNAPIETPRTNRPVVFQTISSRYPPRQTDQLQTLNWLLSQVRCASTDKQFIYKLCSEQFKWLTCRDQPGQYRLCSLCCVSAQTAS